MSKDVGSIKSCIEYEQGQRHAQIRARRQLISSMSKDDAEPLKSSMSKDFECLESRTHRGVYAQITGAIDFEYEQGQRNAQVTEAIDSSMSKDVDSINSRKHLHGV